MLSPILIFGRGLASKAPLLVNLATQLPVAARSRQVAGGHAAAAQHPGFCPQTFRSWFQSGSRANSSSARQSFLWPDTFNNYFLPHTAKAAVEVLEAAGFQVQLPRANSVLRTPALRLWHASIAPSACCCKTLDILAPEIEAGIPVVVLEPSCATVFRDELINLFPKDHRAQKLSRQTFLLSEFLQTKASHFKLPHLPRRALVHGHCHHKSVMKMTAEEAVLRSMGMDFYAPAPGCCGMAGSFGFEAEKYDLSVAIGELEFCRRCAKPLPIA